MVDATTSHEALSFMDVSSGYNQIRMSPEDEELTAFRTPKGIYCYKVMPFGLKNAGTKFRRARVHSRLGNRRYNCRLGDLSLEINGVDKMTSKRGIMG
ncbi:unnamed protein product [Prunus armeniaca]